MCWGACVHRPRAGDPAPTSPDPPKISARLLEAAQTGVRPRILTLSI